MKFILLKFKYIDMNMFLKLKLFPAIIFLTFIISTHFTSAIQENVRSKLNSPNKNMVTDDRPKMASNLLAYGKSISTKPRYLELCVVTDISVYKYFKHDKEDIIKHVRTFVKEVNAIFQPIHIHVVLVSLEIWDGKEEFQVTEDSGLILHNLAKYRPELLDDIHHDATVLLTNVDIDGNVIGKAIVGTMCERHNSVAVVQMSGEGTASVVAHELGHVLGMEHDEKYMGCSCQSRKCIMGANNTGTSDNSNQWSSCSVKDLNEHLETGLYKCLDNIPQHPLKPPICGDGLLQSPEECDCGPAAYCDNPCCDPTTCKLTENAVCAVGLCCDLKTCNYKPKHATCREAENKCDLPEFCSGYSEVCPKDVFLINGAGCKETFKGHCWNGQCHSREASCRDKYGPDGVVASDRCYKHYGLTEECVSRKNGKQQCTRGCSALICHTDNPNKHVKKAFGSVPMDGKTTCFNIKRNGISDLVEDGSPCGDGKLCHNHQCVAIRKPAVGADIQCNGRGKYNSNWNCHCDDGYAPPDCIAPGFGGSIDSNQVGLYLETYVIVLLVLFLGILPLIILTWWIFAKSPAWWRLTGRGWTKSWSPCCSTCLDSYCCPLIGMISEEVKAKITPGSKILVENIHNQPKRNQTPQIVNPHPVIPDKKTPSGDPIFITKSTIPDSKFITKTKSINRLNPRNIPNDSFKKKQKVINNFFSISKTPNSTNENIPSSTPVRPAPPLPSLHTSTTPTPLFSNRRNLPVWPPPSLSTTRI